MGEDELTPARVRLMESGAIPGTDGLYPIERILLGRAHANRLPIANTRAELDALINALEALGRHRLGRLTDLATLHRKLNP